MLSHFDKTSKTNFFMLFHFDKTSKTFLSDTYSGELRFKPNVVRSIPGARATRLGSFSAALINVNRPTIPNWSLTIPLGMFETVPEKINA